jgi:hypothetical protein
MGTSPDVAPVDGATCADTSPAAAIRNVDRMKITFFMIFVLCVCVEFLFRICYKGSTGSTRVKYGVNETVFSVNGEHMVNDLSFDGAVRVKLKPVYYRLQCS